ncbi:hypothetical protein SAMN05444920_10489 [Nonomuraea solani]|uniref:Glycosyl hydrolase catalytic core n=1 Tax=Nonomuraea solani TaxID=1144553 RepID=A0A1H6CLA4_9ACTN|nr:hypothetical protein [Nonomuraea solani]SEG73527.1 hypothetical protein SAMN05444920_10489 [Nonomuraea solani]
MATRKVPKRLLLVALVLLIGVGWVVAQVRASAERFDLPRVTWEGGPAYYARFGAAADAGWTKPDFFPIGVWFESVVEERDVRLDKEAGLNTYVELTANSNMGLVRSNGMSAITSKPLPGAGGETVGWMIADEADMFAGPGDGVWSGKYGGEGQVCLPDKPPCGYTAMRTLKDKLPKNDGRMHYANYGKGIAMWESDAEADRFVNGYTDIMSTDVYWYTDTGICPEAANFIKLTSDRCPRAANYGRVVDRGRRLDALDGRRQPVYAFVELGWPGTNGLRSITPDEVAGAVMNSLIHEARGIIYFNHSFAGPCPTQHVLREPCAKDIRAAVTELNGRIRSLAPVLNTQSYVHSFNPELDTMLKGHDGSYYVFAMVGEATAPGPQTLRLPEGLATAGNVEVMFENRTVPVRDGAFTDTFERPDSYHVYRITP